MNLVKRSLELSGTRGGVKALGGVEASLLLAFNLLSWAPASSSCSMESTRGLTRGLRRVVRDPGAIAKDRGLNVIFLNGLANPLNMELLEL